MVWDCLVGLYFRYAPIVWAAWWRVFTVVLKDVGWPVRVTGPLTVRSHARRRRSEPGGP